MSARTRDARGESNENLWIIKAILKPFYSFGRKNRQLPSMKSERETENLLCLDTNDLEFNTSSIAALLSGQQFLR